MLNRGLIQGFKFNIDYFDAYLCDKTSSNTQDMYTILHSSTSDNQKTILNLTISTSRLDLVVFGEEDGTSYSFSLEFYKATYIPEDFFENVE